MAAAPMNYFMASVDGGTGLIITFVPHGYGGLGATVG